MVFTNVFVFFLFVVLVLSQHQQLYEQVQVITNSHEGLRLVVMSDDNKYLYTAGYTDTKNLYVYENINNVYTPIQTIPQFTHYIQGIQVTKDNQWLVVASEDDYTYVYTLNSSGLYEQTQRILKQTTTGSFAVAITDDHQFLAFGKGSSNIHIYKHNGSQFEFNQTITKPINFVRSLAMSNDHQFLIGGIYEWTNYVFKYNSTSQQFQHSQNLSYSSGDYRYVFLSDDSKLLVVTSRRERTIYIYEYDGSQFNVIQNLTGSTTNVTKAHLSGDKSTIIFGNGNGQCHIYVHNGVKYQQKQIVDYNINQYSECFISKDKKYVVINGKNKTYIMQQIRNQTQCQIQNCLQCQNLTHCSECDTNSSYFMSPSGTCQACTLSNCLQCQNLTHCSECVPIINVHLKQGKCFKNRPIISSISVKPWQITLYSALFMFCISSFALIMVLIFCPTNKTLQNESISNKYINKYESQSLKNIYQKDNRQHKPDIITITFD